MSLQRQITLIHLHRETETPLAASRYKGFYRFILVKLRELTETYTGENVHYDLFKQKQLITGIIFFLSFLSRSHDN